MRVWPHSFIGIRTMVEECPYYLEFPMVGCQTQRPEGYVVGVLCIRVGAAPQASVVAAQRGHLF